MRTAVLAAFLVACTSFEPPEARTPEQASEACEGGCTAPPAPDVDAATLDAHLAAFAALAPGEESLAVDTLLFHRDATRARLESTEVPLSPEHRAFLEAQLALTHARVGVRLVTEAGVVRARITDLVVPLGERRHVHVPERVRLPPLELSGTVVRVGLRHLWSRY